MILPFVVFHMPTVLSSQSNIVDVTIPSVCFDTEIGSYFGLEFSTLDN